jgi:hypothetical protein
MYICLYSMCSPCVPGTSWTFFLCADSLSWCWCGHCCAWTLVRSVLTDLLFGLRVPFVWILALPVLWLWPSLRIWLSVWIMTFYLNCDPSCRMWPSKWSLVLCVHSDHLCGVCSSWIWPSLLVRALCVNIDPSCGSGLFVIVPLCLDFWSSVPVLANCVDSGFLCGFWPVCRSGPYCVSDPLRLFRPFLRILPFVQFLPSLWILAICVEVVALL